MREKALEVRLGVEGLKVGGYGVRGAVGLKGEVDIGKVLGGKWEEMGALEEEGSVRVEGPGLKLVEQHVGLKVEEGTD